jgi:hypothetical protein
MEELLARIGKAMIVAAVAFGAIFYIFNDMAMAMVVMLLPLVLGMLNILTPVAYSLTAVVFMAAIAFAILPTDNGLRQAVRAGELVTYMQNLTNQHKGDDAPATPAPAAPK